MNQTNNPLCNLKELELISNKIRGKIVEMSHQSRSPHLGSALSCVDILVTLYWKILNINPSDFNDPTRDRFILSKGHAAQAIYTTLAYRGFFPINLLNSYVQNGSHLAEHPAAFCVPGIEAATGSLGHGLPIGVGMALSTKIKGNNFRVFVLMGDGECNEGSVWEAAMFASSKKLNNLFLIIDYNKWQATGRSQEIMSLEPLKKKWEAFGWDSYEVDGNDLNSLISIFEKTNHNDKPTAIIAHTIKGKGISFMEDDNDWHYRIPTEEELKKAKIELKLL